MSLDATVVKSVRFGNETPVGGGSVVATDDSGITISKSCNAGWSGHDLAVPAFNKADVQTFFLQADGGDLTVDLVQGSNVQSIVLLDGIPFLWDDSYATEIPCPLTDDVSDIEVSNSEAVAVQLTGRIALVSP